VPDERASDRVHERLRADVLSGAIAVGERIPSERALATEHGVNRHAVREALKRLEQAGLVSISQGGPTRVRDWTRTGGLELLLDLIAPSAQATPPELARGVLEMRASIGVDAARRCAGRADDLRRTDVLRAAHDAAAAAESGEVGAVVASYAALWEHVVLGADNLAYRLSLNSLALALAGHEDLLRRTLPTPADAAAIRRLGTAIHEGDPGAAADAARSLLDDDALPGG
jgi:DNA-binding FadR family transcriptional regulator